MTKYNFYDDYSEGAHPAILQMLQDTNNAQHLGYGNDELCASAATLLKGEIKNPDADLHFVTGGTQANLIMLATMLRPYESVIAAQSAHINTREAGAIEATGHKIQTANCPDGKLTVEQIKKIMEENPNEHFAKPKAVFVSQASEMGTVYTKAELTSISEFCRQNNLYLYLDGARLGMALVSEKCDLEMPDISALSDAFYIGGTKNGAILGEVLVINSDELKPNFRYMLKQRGGLLAKGRLLGVQFMALFKDGLYYDLARHANRMAQKISQALTEKGYAPATPTDINQVFVVLPNDYIAKLQQDYGFYALAKIDENRSLARFVTSWATDESMVEEFCALINVS